MRPFRPFVLAVLLIGTLLAASLPATAAGPKRIFLTKYDENFMGQSGVTFELYEDTNGNGVRDSGEPLLQTKVTDSAGAATFDPVNPGKYVVHEVTPSGYVDNPDKDVEIPNARGRGPSIVFSNTPKPSNNRVNDPTSDTSLDDGTHVFDFGPSVGVDPTTGQILVAWNDTTGFHSPGGVSLTNTARSTDGGETWDQLGKVPTGSASFFNLGDPIVLYDQALDRWILASNSIGVTGPPPGELVSPILVNTSGGAFGFWGTPVNATPNVVPGSGDIAHGASLALDPTSGQLALGFVVSHGNGTSEAMATISDDGGGSFLPAIALSDRKEGVDFIDIDVGPNGTFHATWREKHPSDLTFDMQYSQSTDGGQTWTSPRPIAVDLPNTGTPDTCVGTGQGSIFGQIFAANAPEIAASPLHRNRLFAAVHTHGSGTDEADVVIFRSTDGGDNWSELATIDDAPALAQFYPDVEVTEDGRVGVTYYEASATDGINVQASFFSAFNGKHLNTYPLTSEPFQLWDLNPSFDTDISNCHGMDKFDFHAPGSGFFTAWTDGRDPGPAGNNGIDPNIYFAHTEGPAISTALSGVVDKTASKLKVGGKVKPMPLPGARVVVTLLHKDGGGFEQIGRKRPKTGNGGKWSTKFGRPDDGKCRILVEFPGAEGREPSVPISATFKC